MSRFVAVVALLFVHAATRAEPITPTVWQQSVAGEQVGKLANWSRDRIPPFFVDDLLLGRPPNEKVDVIVDFNRPLSEKDAKDLLDGFGTVTYMGRVLSFALVSGVYVRQLEALGRRPFVAMVEWQAPIRLASDVASRAVQARTSAAYRRKSAEELGGNGDNVTIAVLDTGIDTITPLAFDQKTRSSVNATVSPPVYTNAPTDLSGLEKHGTQVASMALGAPLPAGQVHASCRAPDDGTPSDCGGTATAANLMDIKVCVSSTCDEIDVVRGLDWLLQNAAGQNVRVANLSFVKYAEDNGGSALCQLVDSLVWQGVTVVAGHGNSTGPDSKGAHPTGSRRSFGPAAASLAISVAAINDLGTIDRGTDTNFEYYLIGPRCNPNCTVGIDDRKPELVAPGDWVAMALPKYPASYEVNSGTSFAAPVVAGAAAILLQKNSALDPGSLKDLLERTADGVRNGTPYPSWTADRGYGTVNVWAAVDAALDPARTFDVGFDYCDPSRVGVPGQPCELKPPAAHPWENGQDIAIQALPPGSSPSHEIRATVKNWGAVAQTVRVQFADRYSSSTNRWTAIGTTEIVVPAGGTAVAVQPYEAPAGVVADVQVRVAFGLDTNYANNLTQRNAIVATPYSPMLLARMQGPLEVFAHCKVLPATWRCALSANNIVPAADEVAHPLYWTLIPPKSARPGETAVVQIRTEMRPQDESSEVIHDGATFTSFAPRACNAKLQVVDAEGKPQKRAKLHLKEVVPRAPGIERVLGKQPVERRLKAGRKGVAKAKLVPYMPYDVEASTGAGTAEGTIRVRCDEPTEIRIRDALLVAATPAETTKPRK
jgi:serine protease AprX